MESLQTYRVRYCGVTQNKTFIRVGMTVEAGDRADAARQVRAHGEAAGCVEMIINQLQEVTA